MQFPWLVSCSPYITYAIQSLWSFKNKKKEEPITMTSCHSLDQNQMQLVPMCVCERVLLCMYLCATNINRYNEFKTSCDCSRCCCCSIAPLLCVCFAAGAKQTQSAEKRGKWMAKLIKVNHEILFGVEQRTNNQRQSVVTILARSIFQTSPTVTQRTLNSRCLKSFPHFWSRCVE